MLLIAGVKNEDPVRLVIESALEAGVSFLFLDQQKLSETDFEFKIDEENYQAELFYEGVKYNLFDFEGVYYRFIETNSIKARKALFNLKLFDLWLETASCKVMNKSSDQISNISKPYQCQIIESAGLKTPQTLVTNDADSVLKFKKENKKIIFKSISSVRSIVHEFDAIKALDINNLKFLPSQFQPLLKGENIRVHLVGKEIFATQMITEAIDYRYASQDDIDCEMKDIELDPETKKKCFIISSMLGLPLCGIDFMLTEYGTYCFEVNPSPGFSYYQRHTGQDISGAIIRYLSDKN